MDFKSNSNNTYFQQYSMKMCLFLFLPVVIEGKLSFLVNMIWRRRWTILVIFPHSAFSLFLKENTVFLLRLLSKLKHHVYRGKVRVKYLCEPESFKLFFGQMLLIIWSPEYLNESVQIYHYNWKRLQSKLTFSIVYL